MDKPPSKTTDSKVRRWPQFGTSMRVTVCFLERTNSLRSDRPKYARKKPEKDAGMIIILRPMPPTQENELRNFGGVSPRRDLAGCRGDTEPPQSLARFDASAASADASYARRIRRERPQIQDLSWRFCLTKFNLFSAVRIGPRCQDKNARETRLASFLLRRSMPGMTF